MKIKWEGISKSWINKLWEWILNSWPWYVYIYFSCYVQGTVVLKLAQIIFVLLIIGLMQFTLVLLHLFSLYTFFYLPSVNYLIHV